MHKSEILVSVIIPCYNVDKYLANCIKSIQEQTHRKLEIILVDDGSPDTSGTIADEFLQKDSRIKVIHKKNGGVSSARNAGLDIATGEYVCFVDADDWVEKDYVEYLLNLAIDNGADMSITRHFHNSFHRHDIEYDVLEIQTPEQATIDLLYYKHMIGVYCKMISRRFIENNHLRFMEDITIGEGFNFTVDCFQRLNKLAVGLKSVYFYRRDNEKSAMTAFHPHKTENAILAMHRMNKRFILRTASVMKAWEFATWHTYSDMYIFIMRGKAINKFPELYSKYKKYTRRKAYYAFSAPICLREKIRAFILMFTPAIYPWLMNKRQNKLEGKKQNIST